MRKLALACALAVTGGLLFGGPAAATYGVVVQLSSSTVYSPAAGPATIRFTFGPGDPDRVFTVRIYRAGDVVKQKDFGVYPATDTSPHDVAFSWPAITVTKPTNYKIDVRQQGTGSVITEDTLTVLPTLVSKLDAAPDTFYPFVDDGYRDNTTITYSLAADTSDTTLHIYRADVYGRCCDTEVRTKGFGPMSTGSHSWDWDGTKDDLTTLVGKGTYFARIDATDTGTTSATSKAFKIVVTSGMIRRTATKEKTGASYARVGPAHATASGGNCNVWRSPPTAGVLCANAEVSVYYRWGLKNNERVQSVSFKVDHGYYVCTHKVGHTASESFIKVHSPPRASCSIVKATIVYSYPYHA